MNVQKKLAIGIIRTKLNLISRIHRKKAGEEAFKLFCTPLNRQPYKESPVLKKGEALQFIINGNLIKGYRINPSPHKILLLHGFSSCCHKFDHYVTPLVKKNYEVLAFDAPAHGRSNGQTVNALEYSEMIKRIIELYGPVNGFIAHSFGGLALTLALENINNENTKVVLIAPATETTSAIDGAFAFLGLKNRAIRKALDEVIFRVSGKETSWFSIRRAIKNIKASVLWIHDEEDDVTPFADALKVKNDNPPNVKFIITRGLGHRNIYRDAAVKLQVINFL